MYNWLQLFNIDIILLYNLNILRLHPVSAVRCPAPQVPPQGRLVEDESGGEYGVGSVIQFSCRPGHTLVGEGSIVCTESGVWSHPPPLCEYTLHPVRHNEDIVFL